MESNFFAAVGDISDAFFIESQFFFPSLMVIYVSSSIYELVLDYAKSMYFLPLFGSSVMSLEQMMLLQQICRRQILHQWGRKGRQVSFLDAFTWHALGVM